MESKHVKQWVATVLMVGLILWVAKQVFLEDGVVPSAPLENKPPSAEVFQQRLHENNVEYCRKYHIQSAECAELLK